MILQAHPTLSEHERKRLCRVMDCQKLSIDACMHAAQNERLPLRVVVQVLFSEQVKISNAIANNSLKEGNAESQYQPMISNRKTLLEATPQSFQEGWSAAKKDINTLKFELESVKAKYLELQNDPTLVRLYEVASTLNDSNETVTTVTLLYPDLVYRSCDDYALGEKAARTYKDLTYANIGSADSLPMLFSKFSFGVNWDGTQVQGRG